MYGVQSTKEGDRGIRTPSFRPPKHNSIKGGGPGREQLKVNTRYYYYVLRYNDAQNAGKLVEIDLCQG